jgi:hypothetical protein
VPKRHIEAGVNLGTWVQRQRTEYRKETLDAERMALLNSVRGWMWNTKHERWEQGFALLQRFSEREGHAQVPDTHYESAFPLGHWVRRQRRLYDSGEPDPTRQARVESVEGWVWDLDAESWERAYALLGVFANREGHARVPTTERVANEVHLGKWVANQRTAFKNGRLDPERAARLDELPGWVWDMQETAWEESFSALSKFAEREGNVDVPKSWVEDGETIGWWIGTQRQVYKQGGLDAERVSRLKSLPGWSWDTIESRWDEGFTRLEAYVASHGDALVPVDYVDDSGSPLGQWCAVQRRRHAIGKLAEERVRRLNELEGWAWDLSAAKQEQAMGVLRQFVDREGHARVPVAHIEDGFPLGAWAAERRKANRRHKLADGVVRELDKLPGWRW